MSTRATNVKNGLVLDDQATTNEMAYVPVSAVPPEDGAAINVGQIGLLVVPAEDIGADDGQDIDFSAQMTPPVRKPEQYEKFSVYPDLVLTTRLLIVRSGAGGLDVKFYYVQPNLRGPVNGGMRDALAIPCWSHRDKRWFVWILNHNPGNTWFDSVQPLLQQKPTSTRTTRSPWSPTAPTRVIVSAPTTPRPRARPIRAARPARCSARPSARSSSSPRRITPSTSS
jgi:hypothetical protein